MAHDLRRRVADENVTLFGGGDPELTAVRVAIYLEDALDLTLPAALIDGEHLGDAAAVGRTLDSLLGDG